MSHQKPDKTSKPPRSFGWIAEYDDENKMLDAARKVRDSGYTRTDVFAPFPVHGIDEALGIKPTHLPWFSLVAGLTGTTVAISMQYWMNGIDYPYIISGKPYFSLPAFVPVMFELTVLFAAFTTIFAMLGLNGLPKFSNPVFTSPRFDKATDDRFFLWVDSRDKYFNSDKVKSLLAGTEPVVVEEVREDESPSDLPKGLLAIIATLILLTVIPLAIVWNIRAVKSGSPRWHVFFDMDFQPFKKAQKQTSIFADGRTERPPVPGTVYRGSADELDPYNSGHRGELAANALTGNQEFRLVGLPGQGVAAQPEASTQEGDEKTDPPAEGGESQKSELNETVGEQPSEPAAEKSETPPKDSPTAEAAPQATTAGSAPASEAPAVAAATPPEVKYDWLTTLPGALAIDEKFIEIGQKKFNQTCAVCHGFAGNGDGLVYQRAQDLVAPNFPKPTSLHDAAVAVQPIGQIFGTITHGKGKMGPYGSALNTQERWAIAFYVKALQRSQNAKEADVKP